MICCVGQNNACASLRSSGIILFLLEIRASYERLLRAPTTSTRLCCNNNDDNNTSAYTRRPITVETVTAEVDLLNECPTVLEVLDAELRGREGTVTPACRSHSPASVTNTLNPKAVRRRGPRRPVDRRLESSHSHREKDRSCRGP
eukprot:336305-Pyramimonas_sp.AAC.1